MTFSDQLIQVLNYLLEKLGIAIDWTQANILPYLEELFRRIIVWQLALRGFWGLVCVLVAIFGLKYGVRGIKRYYGDGDDNYEDMDMFVGIVGICFGVIAILVLLGLVASMIKIAVVPEVWFLDYAKNFMGGGNLS